MLFNLDILKHLRQAFYHQRTILGYTKVDIFIKTIFLQCTNVKITQNWDFPWLGWERDHR